MPEQSLSSKYFCNCLTRLCSQTAASASESNDRIYCVSSARSEAQAIYENYYIQWLLLLFLVIYSASLSGSDDFVLFDSLDGKETVLICKCFMRYSNFAHKLNSQLWMETRLLFATIYSVFSLIRLLNIQCIPKYNSSFYKRMLHCYH